MNFKQKNRFKAAVLLIVFSMNTVVGFACGLGLDLSGSKDHHNSVAINRSHSEQPEKIQPHAHTHEGDSHHHEVKVVDKEKTPEEPGKGDDCCSNHVVPLQQVDKAIPASISLPFFIFLTSFFHSYITKDIPEPGWARNTFLQFDRWRPLSTIPDIRIFIQSFQI